MSRQPRIITPKDVEIAERLASLVEMLYGGNQSKASRATGISQSQISNVLNGQRPATENVLAAFTRIAGVNPKWLRDGEGDPLIAPTAGTLPVANFPLLGPPAEFGHLLDGGRHPVSAVRDFDTRYWLRLNQNSPLLQEDSLRMLPGDFLLIETHRDHLDRLDVVDGALCVLKSDDTTSVQLSVERVSVETEPAWKKGEPLPPGGRHKRSVRIRRNESEPPSEKKKQRPAKSQTSHSVGLVEIVGVALMLERPSLRFS